jgi:RNA polymerase sigma-70 factor (ECF subfamily)
MAANSEKLSGFIYKKCDRKNEINEIYQITQVKAWKNLKKFKCNSSFYTWICRIATNLIIDDYRKNVSKSKTLLFSDFEAEDGRSFFESILTKNNLTCENGGDKEIDRRDLKVAIRDCIEEVSKDHKKILKMFFFDSMRYEEIAKKLNISVGTVMSRLFHAKKNVGKVFKLKYKNHEFSA